MFCKVEMAVAPLPPMFGGDYGKGEGALLKNLIYVILTSKCIT
jgi:hypothetical protein